MASIVNDPGGLKRISFAAAGGKRGSIRLGSVPQSLAQDVCDMITRIQSCMHAPHLLGNDVVEWARKLPGPLYDKIARAGFLPAREIAPAAVGVTIQQLIAAVTLELAHKKLSTRVRYATHYAHLLEYFTAGRSVAGVTPRDADSFITWLRTEKQHSAPTVTRSSKAFRFLFNRACRWDWIARNPFDGIKGGATTDHSRKHFISVEDFETLIDNMPDREFRCVLALSRYGALRCPSEVLKLRWIDVRWAEGKMFVRSPKTEGHEGGEFREVPLFPRLYEILWDWFEHAPEGSVHIIESSRESTKNFRTRLIRLIERAGLKQWPKLFHNMRASRESELLADYPLVTVCKWLGHSPSVAANHYLMDPRQDANFRQAAGIPPLPSPSSSPPSPGKATRQATRASYPQGGQEGTEGDTVPAKTPENAAIVGKSTTDNWAMRGSNSRAFAGKSGAQTQVDAQSDARPSPTPPGGGGDPLLLTLSELWPTLPAAVRSSIVALAQAAAGGGK